MGSFKIGSNDSGSKPISSESTQGTASWMSSLLPKEIKSIVSSLGEAGAWVKNITKNATSALNGGVSQHGVRAGMFLVGSTVSIVLGYAGSEYNEIFGAIAVGLLMAKNIMLLKDIIDVSGNKKQVMTAEQKSEHIVRNIKSIAKNSLIAAAIFIVPIAPVVVGIGAALVGGSLGKPDRSPKKELGQDKVASAKFVSAMKSGVMGKVSALFNFVKGGPAKEAVKVMGEETEALISGGLSSILDNDVSVENVRNELIMQFGDDWKKMSLKEKRQIVQETIDHDNDVFHDAI